MIVILYYLVSILVCIQSQSHPLCSVTAVSGYWSINNINQINTESNSCNLKINTPLVYFYNNDIDKTFVQSLRVGYPTQFIKLNANELIGTNQIKNSLLNNKENIITANNVELDLENVFLIQRVILLNPYHTDWFAWIDSGHNSDLSTASSSTANNKNSIPMLKWPDQVQLDKLPIDKFIHNNRITTTTTNSTTTGATFIYHMSISNTITEPPQWQCPKGGK